MPVSTDQLFVILLGAGSASPDAYAFCINRPIDDVALCIIDLRQIEGVQDYVKADRSIDHDDNQQTIIEVTFEDRSNMPAVFGRIAVAFAEHLGVSYRDTLLFREVAGDDVEQSELSFMELPSYGLTFPGTFPESIGSVDELLEEIEKTFRTA